MKGQRPHKDNACSGRYADWLEVLLTPDCNGGCAWCVERQGWHPEARASWRDLLGAAVKSGESTVMLLGGEPTLYTDLKALMAGLGQARKLIGITTNASKLTPEWVRENLAGVSKVNLSIHRYHLAVNKEITGIQLDRVTLRESIAELHKMGAPVRLNCNVIKGRIDDRSKAEIYIEVARDLGADAVRFAELKHDADMFRSLADMFHHQHGLNADPFTLGCAKDAVIHDMPVNFRQMCGFQNPLRPTPDNPIWPRAKHVLYYDGIIYDGWQTRGGNDMRRAKMAKVIQAAIDGVITAEEAAKKIKPDEEQPDKKKGKRLPVVPASSGGYCSY